MSTPRAASAMGDGAQFQRIKKAALLASRSRVDRDMPEVGF